jgi:hypothetical protein
MDSALARYRRAVATMPKPSQPPRLMDIGCSGGVERDFLDAMPCLIVDGFDPLVEEVERLNNLRIPGHSYHNYFVGTNVSVLSEKLPPLSKRYSSNTTFHLTSAHAAQETLRGKGTSYTQEMFNTGISPTYTDKKITISEFLDSASKPTPNFLKVDTDGHDYFVLEGAGDLLDSNSLIGIKVECQFHGELGPRKNTFSNIDDLLRSKGFTLFALDTHKYSRADLPQPFVWNLFGQTISGQVQWGEAVYFRDPTIDGDFCTHLADNEDVLIHYITFLLLSSLPDMVAATINTLVNIRGLQIPWAQSFLDEIVPRNLLGAKSYNKYIKAFTKAPEKFLPAKGRFPLAQLRLILNAIARQVF